MKRLGLGVIQMALLLAFVGGCGKQVTSGVTAAETACKPTTAQIRVGDGFLQRICGCTEAAGFIMQGQNFSCTVPAGTTVFFHFIAVQNEHQIVSVGTPGFVSLPLVDPKVAQGPIISQAQVFGLAGTYQFKDLFNPSVTGSLVVQ